VAIRRRDAIEPCIAALLELTDEVFDVELASVLEARDLVLEHRTLSARDALHAAIMRRHGIGRILSFDRGFDELEGIERISA
jgi:predicted nucleic acid-binding protein